MVLVTGGAGFIGSNFVLRWMATRDEPLVVVDKLTYAGRRDRLNAVMHDPRLRFVQADVGETHTILALLEAHQPRAIVHLAAETHVDRSIAGPGEFVRTNVVGTFGLLEAIRIYLDKRGATEQSAFRYLH
ncbi:MAG TPA: GDP-mannose 4,6-dehydratase, partial [Burkholderiaceae bacterium]|nr:GDP-mannose 4,6-dehydratase [Burkholderiaceae bacterium]